MTTATAADFYDAALASTGLFYIGPKAGKKLQKDRPSFDKKLGHHPDLYHSMAQFRDPTLGRKAENIISLHSFRLDIDTLLTHLNALYATQAEALAAFNLFMLAVGLPLPWIVDSGGGWHIYWMLDADAPHDQWKETALLLKAACKTQGLAIDAGLTADGTRLLRAIGSINPKTGKTVTIVQQGVTCTHAYFRVKLEDYTGITASAAPARAKANGHDTGNMLTNIRHPDSFADDAADKCQLLGDLRAGNDQDYDLWTAALSNLSRMADGREKAHDWSKLQRPNEYDEAVTDQKLDEFKGPRTCGWIKSNGGPCDGCPHYYATLSPVQLGTGGATVVTPQLQQTPSQPPPTPPPAAPTPTAGPAPVPPPPSPMPPPPAPYLTGVYPTNGYVRVFPPSPDRQAFYWAYDKDPAGQRHPYRATVFIKPGKKDTSIVTEFSHNAALFATGVALNSKHTLHCSCRYALGHGNPLANEDRFTLQQGELHGPTLMGRLGENGFSVSSPDQIAAVKVFIGKWYEAARTHANITGTASFGLLENGEFHVGHHAVRPDGSITTSAPTGSADTFLTRFNQLPDTSKPELLKKAREWGAQVDTLFSHDELLAHQFVIASSFGSMLWGLEERSIGGLTISATGQTSGLAKTSCIRVAGSVWGNSSYHMASSSTANAISDAAGTLKSLPLIIDEVTSMPTAAMVKLISDLGGGSDRARLTATATARDVKVWQLLVLMTSNNQLSGYAAGKQLAGGINARLWELPFDKHNPATLRARLRAEWKAKKPGAISPDQFENSRPDAVISDLCSRLGGYAGLQLATDAMPRRAAIAAQVTATTERLSRLLGGTEDSGNRAATTAAACALTALAILNQRRILSFDCAKMEAWVLRQLAARSQTAADTVYDPLTEFTATFHNEIGTIRRYINGGTGKIYSNDLEPRSVTAVFDVSAQLLYLFRPSLQKWFAESGMTILDALRQSGRLLDERCEVPADMRLDDMVTPPCYKISMQTAVAVGAAPPVSRHPPIPGTTNVVNIHQTKSP